MNHSSDLPHVVTKMWMQIAVQFYLHHQASWKQKCYIIIQVIYRIIQVINKLIGICSTSSYSYTIRHKQTPRRTECCKKSDHAEKPKEHISLNILLICIRLWAILDLNLPMPRKMIYIDTRTMSSKTLKDLGFFQ